MVQLFATISYKRSELLGKKAGQAALDLQGLEESLEGADAKDSIIKEDAKAKLLEELDGQNIYAYEQKAGEWRKSFVSFQKQKTMGLLDKTSMNASVGNYTTSFASKSQTEGGLKAGED